jgi:hypothetical protein
VKTITALAAACALLAIPTLAHHPTAGTFDTSKTVKMEGEVTRLTWANPHVKLTLGVKGANGAVTNWECETQGPTALIRQGWKQDSVKVGDRLALEGYIAKDGSKKVDAKTITLADGRTFALGGGEKAAKTPAKTAKAAEHTH